VGFNSAPHHHKREIKKKKEKKKDLNVRAAARE